MAEFDADAALAARRNGNGQVPADHVLRFKGHEFALPGAIDVLALADVMDRKDEPGHLKRYFLFWMGEEQYDVLRGMHPDTVELEVLDEAIGSLYEVPVPESSASGA